jgi:hypothetical protein
MFSTKAACKELVVPSNETVISWYPRSLLQPFFLGAGHNNSTRVNKVKED